jgi:hypothetical protein
LNERFEQYINGKRENIHSNFTLRLKKILWEARSTPTLAVLAYFISAVLIIEVLFVAITRPLSIYYGMILNDINDNTMLVSCRIVNLIFCSSMVIYDVMYHNYPELFGCTSPRGLL